MFFAKDQTSVQDPFQQVVDNLDVIWDAVCKTYDVSYTPLDLRTAFENVDLNCAEGAARTVIANMLLEVTQQVHRFSRWNSAPVRAFGLTSHRNPQTNAIVWGLAPEALHKWRDAIFMLVSEFEGRMGLIKTLLMMEDIGDSFDDPNEKVLAVCQCAPPSKIWIADSLLKKSEIVCENCNAIFSRA